MAPSGSRGGGIKMWPSEAWATWLYDAANIALIVGLITGAIATVLIVWMGNVKEAYLKKDLASTNARAAALSNDAAQARLEQERLKAAVAWRRLSLPQYTSLVSALKGRHMKVWVEWVDSDPESTQFADDILRALGAAGLETHVFHGYERAVGFRISLGLSENGKISENAKILKEAFSSVG